MEKLNNVSSASLAANNPLGSWHANLYHIDGRQCVLFCHDATRYMLFAPGLKNDHFVNLGRVHRDLFIMSLAAFGLPDAKIMRAGLMLGPAFFDSSTDRSVLGSMNIALGDLDASLEEVDNLLELDLVSAAVDLNMRPVSIRGDWHWPDRKMIELVESL